MGGYTTYTLLGATDGTLQFEVRRCRFTSTETKKMAETFGERFQRLRKERGLTQDRIAEAVNVSSQAVSKWENDINMPDITLLLPLSELLGVTTDELLGKEKHEVMIIEDPEKKKDIMKMMFRIKVSTTEGDKVNIQLPMALMKIAIDSGMSMPEVSGKVDLTQFDWKQILDLVEQGVIGEIVKVDTAEGDQVSIIIE